MRASPPWCSTTSSPTPPDAVDPAKLVAAARHQFSGPVDVARDNDVFDVHSMAVAR